jgi:predicted ATP-grasp superfamily ATP-dependent carboligase
METILITGARSPIALEIARSFFKAGHRIIMADSLQLPISRWSNTIDKYYTLPSPRYNTLDYKKSIIDLVKKEKITHLIPVCEETFYISMFINEIGCKVWTSDIALIKQLHNKYFFSKFGKPYLPIPETILVSDFSHWESSIGYVFKPIYSRFGTSTIIKKNIKEDYFANIDQTGWIAQKFIKGKEVCVYSIWDRGKIKAFVCYEPLYRTGNGAAIYFVPKEHSEIKNLVVNFGEQTNYSGQLCFDVIIDENNNPYFIECNPRATNGAHLVNTDIANAFFQQPFLEVKNSNEYALKFALIYFFPLSFLSERIRRAKDVIFRWRDIMPFVLQFLCSLEIMSIKFKHKVSLIEATTIDVDWNGD